MHRFDAATADLAAQVLRRARERLQLDPVPLDAPRSPAELTAAAGQTITAAGLGGQAALDLFCDVLAPACLSTDHPRYLSFIPCAATEAATLFDLVVGASSVYGGSWLEGAGAVYAENQALRWIADLAGLPAGAGGVFVPGGTTGNLSALLAARSAVRAREGHRRPLKVAAAATAHSSIASTCDVLDLQVVPVPVDARTGRLTGAALTAALGTDRSDLAAVVATAGSTNLGTVDDIASVADYCHAPDTAGTPPTWLHVDGAYGGAGLAAPTVRHLFTGTERADSFIVDPHKWLFAPFDSCALLYRDPATARAAHTQRASYLDVLTERGEWDPADYAIGLTRRARGLPFWFSLAAHGADAYTAAVERTLQVARAAAAMVAGRAELQLVREPDLSVVAFFRRGWATADYTAWSERLLAEQFAFVVPSAHEGRTCLRLAIVNPRTGEDDIAAVLDTLR
ncbi:pyridoxal phosphate-dependent decarboxylase family protein [Kineococcus glutinatus]